MIKHNKSILFISSNAIGDTYLTISGAEYAIRNVLKNYHIHYAVAGNASFLLKDELNIYQVFYIKGKNILSLIKTIMKIRKFNYDYAFNFFPGIFNSLLLFLSGSKIKLGYVNFWKVTEWYNKVQKVYCKGIERNGKVWSPEMNYLDRINIVFELISGTKHSVKKYRYPVESHIDTNNIIFISLNSRIKEKSVPFDISNRLIENLRQKFQVPLVILDTDKVFEMFDDRIILLSGNDFNEILSYIRYCKIFIGVDSFPLHLADSYSRNIIGIFRRNYPEAAIQNKETAFILRYETNDSDRFISDVINKIKYFYSIEN